MRSHRWQNQDSGISSAMDRREVDVCRPDQPSSPSDASDPRAAKLILRSHLRRATKAGACTAVLSENPPKLVSSHVGLRFLASAGAPRSSLTWPWSLSPNRDVKSPVYRVFGGIHSSLGNLPSAIVRAPHQLFRRRPAPDVTGRSRPD